MWNIKYIYVLSLTKKGNTSQIFELLTFQQKKVALNDCNVKINFTVSMHHGN